MCDNNKNIWNKICLKKYIIKYCYVKIGIFYVARLSVLTYFFIQEITARDKARYTDVCLWLAYSSKIKMGHIKIQWHSRNLRLKMHKIMQKIKKINILWFKSFTIVKSLC